MALIRSNGVASGRRMPLTVGHDVADVGILFDRHEFIDLHAAESADATQIIPFEIDEHEVLRPFLFICEQFADEALIVSGVGSARSGSGNRPCVHPSVVRRTSRSGEELIRVTSSKCISPEKGEGLTAWRRR